MSERGRKGVRSLSCSQVYTSIGLGKAPTKILSEVGKQKVCMSVNKRGKGLSDVSSQVQLSTMKGSFIWPHMFH